MLLMFLLFSTCKCCIAFFKEFIGRHTLDGPKQFSTVDRFPPQGGFGLRRLLANILFVCELQYIYTMNIV